MGELILNLILGEEIILKKTDVVSSWGRDYYWPIRRLEAEEVQ